MDILQTSSTVKIEPIIGTIIQQQHLPNLWVGIGCQKGVSSRLIATAIQQVFAENQLRENTIAGLATIDTKASEVGLIELCHLCNFPLKLFPSNILSTVSVPHPSKIAAKTVGTSSVAEAAAILAASYITPPFTRKEELEIRLLVPKQVFRLESEPGSVTLAVATNDR